jgi:KTSC domain
MKKKKYEPKWRKPMIESSNVAALAHDSKTETLYIRFHNGDEYSYNNVDEALYLKLSNAPSIGSFLNKEIIANKAAFPVAKI